MLHVWPENVRERGYTTYVREGNDRGHDTSVRRGVMRERSAATTRNIARKILEKITAVCVCVRANEDILRLNSSSVILAVVSGNKRGKNVFGPWRLGILIVDRLGGCRRPYFLFLLCAFFFFGAWEKKKKKLTLGVNRWCTHAIHKIFFVS